MLSSIVKKLSPSFGTTFLFKLYLAMAIYMKISTERRDSLFGSVCSCAPQTYGQIASEIKRQGIRCLAYERQNHLVTNGQQGD